MKIVRKEITVKLDSPNEKISVNLIRNTYKIEDDFDVNKCGYNDTGEYFSVEFILKEQP